jgi:ABC-2 type transport system permease protein
VKGIWIARLQNLKRKPLVLIMMTLMTLVLAYVLSGGVGSQTPILIALDDTSTSKEVLDELNTFEEYSIKEVTKDVLYEKVEQDPDLIGVHLTQTAYTVLTGTETDSVREISLAIETAYSENAFQQKIIEMGGELKWLEVKENLSNQEAFQMNTSAMDEAQVFRYDGALQSLFGYMLFFVFYTISTNVQFILEDKRTGVWNRLKLASISRFQLYFGHLSFSFIIGLLQMLLVILVFRFVVGTNMYGALLEVILITSIYVLLVLAVSLLIISLVKTVSQSGVIISLLAVAFAMIGGAYWPLEIVQSEGLLAMKWLSPIYYAMEALKRITIYGETLGAVSTYLWMMLLFAATLISGAIYLLEKKSERGHSIE